MVIMVFVMIFFSLAESSSQLHLKPMCLKRSEICFAVENAAILICYFLQNGDLQLGLDKNKCKTNPNSFWYACKKYIMPQIDETLDIK